MNEFQKERGVGEGKNDEFLCSMKLYKHMMTETKLYKSSRRGIHVQSRPQTDSKFSDTLASQALFFPYLHRSVPQDVHEQVNITEQKQSIPTIWT